MTQHKLPEGDESTSSSSPRRSSTMNAATSNSTGDADGSSPGTPSKRKPLGPRSPLRAETMPTSPSSRERAGSSRTSFITSPIRSNPSSPVRQRVTSPLMTTEPLRTSPDESSHAPYREPEVVVESPEQPPAYVAGVVEEHLDDDDMMPPPSPIQTADQSLVKMHVDSWKAEVQPYNGDMDIDGMEMPSRPQIGPGMTVRRMLQEAHPHEVFRLDPDYMPVYRPSDKDPVVENPRKRDWEDVKEAAPGDWNEWFFCPTCWAWLHMQKREGVPQVDDMDLWEAKHFGKAVEDLSEEENADRNLRQSEMTTLALLLESRPKTKSYINIEEHMDHFHTFKRLLYREKGRRIERVHMNDSQWNDFPAVVSDLDELGQDLAQGKEAFPTLYMSCTSQTFLIVSEPSPGQIPRGLANRLVEERGMNPRVGSEGHDALEAWELLSKILSNVLFLGQSKWLKLQSKAMVNKLGQTETVVLLMYCIGFGCKNDPKLEEHRSGPFMRTEDAQPIMTDAEYEQMDQYMMRTWLEIELYLHIYRKRNHLPESSTWRGLNLRKPGHAWDRRKHLNQGYSDAHKSALSTLGVNKTEEAAAIRTAYNMQCACDDQNRPLYLSALVALSEDNIVGKEDLQMSVMMERSMGMYTLEDVQQAYARIGYSVEHASAIDVEASDAPEDYILDLHKKAVLATNTSVEKQEVFDALKLIGRHRGSDTILGYANDGKTVMSVREAYEALSCPMDAVDDGLVMQYEMAVNEYPGKTDHYRKCLETIANAPGSERPGILQFLGTGELGPPAPLRKDIPVGLQNIGNTCYLNSILQYLYSIKPLRDAVLEFEQSIDAPIIPVKPEVERSRRFVRQLRVLFLQLYGSETPSVRPDEELAYLAITRPEMDAIIEPAPDTVKPGKITLDTIPDMPSPTLSTTDIGSIRDASPDVVKPADPAIVEDRFGHSVLGKRASEDRDSIGSSKEDRHRLKSESRISESELVESPFMETGPSYTALDPRKQDSVGPVSTLADLHLKSPPASPVMDDDTASTYFDTAEPPTVPAEDPVKYDPPSIPPPLPTRPPARRASTLASGLKFGLQQDSAEVLINVLGQLELAFDPPKAEEGDAQRKNLISELFSCTYRQQMFVQSVDGTEERRTPVESVFVHPIIGVEEEGKDLYECLGELYLSGSEIEYEGKKGYIMDHMERFPPLLYIQMRRSQFDMATGRERKTNTHIPFGQTLAMDRFLSTAEPEKRDKSMALTREMTRLRSRLHGLQDKKPLPINETFAHLQEALTQFKDQPEFAISDDLLEALKAEGEGIVEETKGMGERLAACKVELDQLWLDDKEYEYELVSVFMHRGKTSGAGHYWTYQSYLPEHPDRFFKYNDELVSEVPAAEVLEDRTGSDANPALLCYVRKGMDLVHTLHRKVLEEAAAGGGEDSAVTGEDSAKQGQETFAGNDPSHGEAEDREAMENVEDVVMDSQPTHENTAPLIEL